MCSGMKRKIERLMMNNRLAGILLFVLFALAFAGCSSSIASTPKVAATPTLKGALEVGIVLSDSAIRASQTTFALGVPYHFVVKNEGARRPGISDHPVLGAAVNPEPGSTGPL